MSYTHHNRHTHMHTTHLHTRTDTKRPINNVLVPGARATYPCGREISPIGTRVVFYAVFFFMTNPGLFQHHPGIFSFHGGTSRPIPTHPLSTDAGQVAMEIGSPDPLKSRRPGARRASTGAHGSRQLSWCPRKPTKRCESVHSFLMG